MIDPTTIKSADDIVWEWIECCQEPIPIDQIIEVLKQNAAMRKELAAMKQESSTGFAIQITDPYCAATKSCPTTLGPVWTGMTGPRK